jgi:hypothetical protein
MVLLLARSAGAENPSAEERALAFLVREVPRWKSENKCYSCHNNGEAARALFAAVRWKRDVPAKALDDTLRFLSRPEEWDQNGPEGPFKDKKLARIQFAAALVDAVEAGVVKDKKPLARAAELVADLQAKDGSFPTGASEPLGSPVTYGLCLQTVMSRRTLQKADAERYRPHIAKADAWLAGAKPESVLDAAAILLAAPGPEQEKRCLDLLRRAQHKDGGWGPFATSPPEAFDTAIALLALQKHTEKSGVKEMIAKGRSSLIASQQVDGSWPATTRPPGVDSYAQRMSTTAWATMALLVSVERR